jgi:hypothetical protein
MRLSCTNFIQSDANSTHRRTQGWSLNAQSTDWFRVKSAFRDARARSLPFIATDRDPYGDIEMLWTVLLFLFVLWLLAMMTHVGGALVHLLLVGALVVIVVGLLNGRRIAL